MRSLKLAIVLPVLLMALAVPGAQAAGKARILKTLQHRLDSEGRHTLSPSLYERDAYQAYLREHPKEVFGLRFDVQWRSIDLDRSQLKLKLEVRSFKTGAEKPVVFETTEREGGLFSNWSSIKLTRAQMDEIGDITAWRLTLWEGDKQVAEQKSFLW